MVARSFLSLFIFCAIGLAMTTKGCGNNNIKKNNTEIRTMSITELVAASPKKPLWIKTKGTPKVVIKDNSSYLLLLELDGKTAIFLKTSDNSPLQQQSGEITVMGMVGPRDATKPIAIHESLPDVKISTLVLDENESPPGFWSTYGLMFLGFFLITVPFKPKGKEV